MGRFPCLVNASKRLPFIRFRFLQSSLEIRQDNGSVFQRNLPRWALLQWVGPKRRFLRSCRSLSRSVLRTG